MNNVSTHVAITRMNRKENGFALSRLLATTTLHHSSDIIQKYLDTSSDGLAQREGILEWPLPLV
jgi:hypothetical protein